MTNPSETDREEIGRQKKISDTRGKWLEELNHPRKIELAFELELHLKALDRFFNTDNLPLTEPDRAVAANFREEFEIALLYMNRIISNARAIMEAGKGHLFQFQNYVETNLLNDLGRTKIREASFEQAAPEESLFLLYTGFINMRGLLRALMKLGNLPYPLYVNMGNMVSREIISNRYFNPAREIEFRPEFDRIENRKISRVVMRIPDDQLRKHFSVTLLVLFRLLKYLGKMNPKTTSVRDLKATIPIFALINSESRQLIDYFEKTLSKALEPGEVPAPNEETTLRLAFVKATDAISFQLSMELKKINRNELMGATKAKDVSHLRSGIENSHGILTNFFQQSIIQITRVFDHQMDGKDIFPFYTSKLRQSLQLRNDSWVFKELMERFEEKAETNTSGDTESIYIRYLNILKDFIQYYRLESYQLLRFDDLREFDKFFSFIDTSNLESLKGKEKLNDFIYRSKYFKIFLETTLGNIEMRSELKNRPLDIRACEKFLKEFIVASMRKTVGGSAQIEDEFPERGEESGEQKSV